MHDSEIFSTFPSIHPSLRPVMSHRLITALHPPLGFNYSPYLAGGRRRRDRNRVGTAGSGGGFHTIGEPTVGPVGVYSRTLGYKGDL